MSEQLLKVFILEDLKTDIELVKRQVLKFNPTSTFTIASSKDEFYEKIEWLQPDIVLSDYGLPSFNGLEALIHIKKVYTNIPFIFVTGTLNDDEKVARAILEGADGFVLKQNLSQLPNTMKDILDKYNQLIEAAKIKAEEERKRKLLLEKLKSKVAALENKADNDILELIQQLQLVNA